MIHYKASANIHASKFFSKKTSTMVFLNNIIGEIDFNSENNHFIKSFCSWLGFTYELWCIAKVMWQVISEKCIQSAVHAKRLRDKNNGTSPTEITNK